MLNCRLDLATIILRRDINVVNYSPDVATSELHNSIRTENLYCRRHMSKRLKQKCFLTFMNTLHNW